MRWQGVTDYRPEIGLKAYFDKIMTHSTDRYKNRVLASATVSDDAYYAAVETLDTQTGEITVSAEICAYEYKPHDPDGFTLEYRNFSETEGILLTDCPAEILNLLTPTTNNDALQWRQACYARLPGHRRRTYAQPRSPSKPRRRKSSYIRVGPYPDRPPNHSSVRELMTRLRVGAPFIRALIANKLVNSTVAENPLNKCPVTVIPDADIAAFESQYVRLFQLAEDHNIHRSRLKKILEQRGVKPALSPQAFHAYIYLRQQAQRALTT
jgi:hypothetical protein